MRRRAYLAGVGAGLAGAGVVGTAAGTNGFTELVAEGAGDPPAEDGSIRVDVVGTSVTEDAEVRTVVDGVVTALAGAHRAETDPETVAEVGIRGYEVHGWSSEESFATQDACTAIEDAARKLEGTEIGSVATVTAWLWDYDASWSAGRGVGRPWARDPDHQHPVFVDNVENPSTRKMAYSTVHEIGHALLSTASGGANCDPEGYDTGSYEACTRARALSAPWYRGHPDHTFGTAIEIDGTLYRTPMAHQGDAYLAGHCRYPVHGVPYNWSFRLSRCTVEAMGHSWRHEAGADGHDDAEHAPPDPVTDAEVTVADDGGVAVAWDPVADTGPAGLAYYGLEVRAHVDGDARWLVPDATGIVPASTTETTLGGLDPDTEYWLRLTPVDEAGNRPRQQFTTTFVTGSSVVDPDADESPVVDPEDPTPGAAVAPPADDAGGGDAENGTSPGDDQAAANETEAGANETEDDVDLPEINESRSEDRDDEAQDSIPGFGAGAALAGLTGASALRLRLRDEGDP